MTSVLKTEKENIKTALTNKRRIITGGMVTYAGLISTIEKIPPIGVKFGFSDWEAVPFDLSKYAYTSTKGMFSGNENLKTAPYIDMSKSLDTSGMFEMCPRMTDFNNGTTANCALSLDTNHMFNYCESLHTVNIYCPSTLDTRYMFGGCISLTDVTIDCTNVENAKYMFSGCISLTNVEITTSNKLTNTDYMFDGCYNLETVSEIDCSSVTNVFKMFPVETTSVNGETFWPQLKNVGGLKNLGMSEYIDTSGLSNLFSYCPYLTRESMLNILNGLYDRAAAGYDVIYTIGIKNVQRRLTEDEIAIGTSKGWLIQA